MPRIRTIKPSFFRSLTVSSLTPEQRLTFIGLWTEADDDGRLIYDARLIKAALWSLDDRSLADVESDIKALTEASLIAHYTLSERSYLSISGWHEHQKINRPSASTLPAPSDCEPTPLSRQNEQFTEGSVRAHGGLTEDSLWERKGKEGKGREERARETGPQPIPTEFRITTDMVEWLNLRCPHLVHENTWRHRTQKFVEHWRSKGDRKTDWTAAWRGWMTQDEMQLHIASKGRPPGRSPDEVDYGAPRLGSPEDLREKAEDARIERELAAMVAARNQEATG